MAEVFDLDWLMATFRVAMPLVLAACGGVICERSGVINIALEGLMLLGALAAAMVVYATSSQWLGLMGGAFAGAFGAAVYGLFVLEGRAQQVVAGAAFNMLILGFTPFMTKSVYGISVGTPMLEPDQIMTQNRDLTTVIMILLTVILSVFLQRWLFTSRSGLILRFAGEEPRALLSAGISPKKIRFLAVIASGVLAGLGGAVLSVVLSSAFSRGMTGGRGYMALAAVIFAGWRPLPAALMCLVFAGTDAAQIRFQGALAVNKSSLSAWLAMIPDQLVHALPYLFAFIAIAIRGGGSSVPRSLGREL